MAVFQLPVAVLARLHSEYKQFLSSVDCVALSRAPSSKAFSLLGFVPNWTKVWGAAARSKEKTNNRLTLTLRTHSSYLSNKMCVCLFVCHLCPPPLLFLFKVNISWVSSFWMCLTSQSRDLLSALSALPDQSVSVLSIHFNPVSRSQCVCVYLYVSVCVCTYTVYVYIYIYRCLYACACALPPSSSVVFYLFSFSAIAWSNECLSLILLSPSSSSFTRLFPFFNLWSVGFLVYSLFYYYIWFIFILPPSPTPPSFFVTQRVGIDQGDSPDLTQVSLHLISISQSTSQSTTI